MFSGHRALFFVELHILDLKVVCSRLDVIIGVHMMTAELALCFEEQTVVTGAKTR